MLACLETWLRDRDWASRWLQHWKLRQRSENNGWGAVGHRNIDWNIL